jgi:hypothetical protein
MDRFIRTIIGTADFIKAKKRSDLQARLPRLSWNVIRLKAT